ncbi:MAG: GntR family transcriptional regulator, partial [Polaromonas sp.]
MSPAKKTAPPAAGVTVPLVSGLSDSESRIYHSVFDSVMNQRIAPGTKLPEQALCELFSANRATVRKVLQRLAHDHIVDLRPNRGAVVAAPTPEETRQIFEAR